MKSLGKHIDKCEDGSVRINPKLIWFMGVIFTIITVVVNLTLVYAQDSFNISEVSEKQKEIVNKQHELQNKYSELQTDYAVLDQRLTGIERDVSTIKDDVKTILREGNPE